MYRTFSICNTNLNPNINEPQAIRSLPPFHDAGLSLRLRSVKTNTQSSIINIRITGFAWKKAGKLKIIFPLLPEKLNFEIRHPLTSFFCPSKHCCKHPFIILIFLVWKPQPFQPMPQEEKILFMLLPAYLLF